MEITKPELWMKMTVRTEKQDPALDAFSKTKLSYPLIVAVIVVSRLRY
jgi:hypothetical protein